MNLSIDLSYIIFESSPVYVSVNTFFAIFSALSVVTFKIVRKNLG